MQGPAFRAKPQALAGQPIISSEQEVPNIDSGLTIVIVLFGIGLAVLLIRLGQALWQVDPAAPIVRVNGAYSPVLTWLRYRRLARLRWQPAAWQRARAWLWPALEIGAIALWAGWFGQIYLNLNPQWIPAGNEFGLSIQSHYIWTLLGRCGACVFWNGFTNGGTPAFVELHGAPLHPLVILATLIWGPVNGAKITVVASFALAGLAQWWLARALRLGRAAGLWSAGMAVVAGNLAGRMEIGLVPLVLSMAMSALVIAACLDLALTAEPGRRRRAAIGLGVLGGLLALAGQGYLQIGLALSVLPALLVLLVERGFRLAPAWKEFALAGALALLLSAVLWVPLAHFWPSLGKDSDPTYQSAQSLGATALNLVISDAEVYYAAAPGQVSLPYLYINYVGWVPLLLALAALPLAARNRHRRVAAFLLAAIVLSLLAASAVILRVVGLALPQIAAWVRNPSLIAGLAGPLVLALAALGLDQLTGLPWPRLQVPRPWRRGPLSAARSPATAGVSSAWLVLALPLAWSLWSAYDFDQTWLAQFQVTPDQQQVVAALKQLVPPGQAQWVQPPLGENVWLTPALDAGLKLASYPRPWGWIGRAFPPAFAEAVRRQPLVGDAAFAPAAPAEFKLITRPDQQYAAVATGSGSVACASTSVGGDVDVTCVTGQAGQLVVLEHAWTSWSAWLDGRPAALDSSQWLTTAAPAGTHSFVFRYRPWDVPLGLAISLLGVVVAVLAWRRTWPYSPL